MPKVFACLKIGLSKVEIKRYFRKKEELLHSTDKQQANEIKKSQPVEHKSFQIKFGQFTFQQPVSQQSPWKDKKFGWIPNATTARAMFMNNLLPSYYKSMFKFCKNAREFVVCFHSEGRWQWDTQSHITKLEDRISAVLNANNPAAAGKYFEEDYILTPSDQTVLRSNLSQLKDVRECNKQLEENLKKHFAGHFSKSEKVLAGHDCGKAFDEETIGKIRKLNDKIADIDANLCEKLETCADMFKKSNSFNGKSKKKRSMKQNRRKARKRKALRDSENMNKLRRCISNTEPSQIIDIDNFNLEALANLTDYQLKYLKMMHKNGHLTTQAVTCIQE